MPIIFTPAFILYAAVVIYMLNKLSHYAPINVNPEGGGGRAKGGGSGKGGGFDQSGGPMGRDLDWHFFY
jgi:uncharacterized membrane protein YgcG